MYVPPLLLDVTVSTNSCNIWPEEQAFAKKRTIIQNNVFVQRRSSFYLTKLTSWVIIVTVSNNSVARMRRFIWTLTQIKVKTTAEPVHRHINYCQFDGCPLQRHLQGSHFPWEQQEIPGSWQLQGSERERMKWLFTNTNKQLIQNNTKGFVCSPKELDPHWF